LKRNIRKVLTSRLDKYREKIQESNLHNNNKSAQTTNTQLKISYSLLYLLLLD